ncbi:MAG: Uma2 family endonuclease [Anaerolineae bacterium]
MVVPVRMMTVEELAQLPDNGARYELSRGELIEMAPPGGEHGSIAGRLAYLLGAVVYPQRLGAVIIETGYVLSRDPDIVRSPDVSFLARVRIPESGITRTFIDGGPDLAVEIVSPGDTAAEVADKVRDYLTYGVRLVWVVEPKTQTVTVYRPDGTARLLQAAADHTLDGEDVIPGFATLVEELFALGM